MKNPTPTTPSTRTTPPAARRAALAALAAAALLLGACGGSSETYYYYEPVLVDLPAWDPEPESAEDAFLYPGEGIFIQSVDGREVVVGQGHWYGDSADAETLYPLGPAPAYSREYKAYLTFEDIQYDSALLRPGPHRIVAVRADAGRAEGQAFNLSLMSEPFELRFNAEPRAAYRLVLHIIPESGGRFMPLVIKSSCPLKDGSWIWPTEWDCYKYGVVAASLDPSHVGMQYDVPAAE